MSQLMIGRAVLYLTIFDWLLNSDDGGAKQILLDFHRSRRKYSAISTTVVPARLALHVIS